MSAHELVAEAVIGKRASAEGWVRVTCPLCELSDTADRKTSMWFSTWTLHYGCHRCGAKGRLREPPEEYDVEARDDAPKARPVSIDPPEGFYPLAGDRSRALAAAREYLRTRGLTEEQIAAAGIGACVSGHFAGRVVVPVRDDQKRWQWFVGRAWRKVHPKPYLYPKGARSGLIYNACALDVETDVPVLVVEGVFDALAHAPHAVAVLGKTTEEHAGGVVYRARHGDGVVYEDEALGLLARARRPVVFVPDGDAWWGSVLPTTMLRVHGLRAGLVRLAPKKDPDEVPRDEIMAAAVASLAQDVAA